MSSKNGIQPPQRVDRLDAVREAMLSAAPLKHDVDAMVDRLLRHYRVYAAWVMLLEQNRQLFVSARALEEAHGQPTELKVIEDNYQADFEEWIRSLSGRTLPVIISDCRQHIYMSSHPMTVSGDTIFLAFAPLMTRQGHLIGVVGIDSPEPRSDFGLGDADYLVEVSHEVRDLLGL